MMPTHHRRGHYIPADACTAKATTINSEMPLMAARWDSWMSGPLAGPYVQIVSSQTIPDTSPGTKLARVAPPCPIVPSTFARSLDAGITGASAVISAFGAVRIAAAPLSGWLTRRAGELRVFCGGLLVVGLSSAACAVAADFGELLAFRAVGGVGSTMFTVSAAALLVRLAPPRLRGRASAAWSAGFLLGTVAGPVIGERSRW